MKKIIFIYFVFNVAIYGQDCKNSFSNEYDKFKKELKSELDHRIVLSTFKTDDGKEWIGNHIGLSWRNNYINDSMDANDTGWQNLRYNGIELNIWAKIQIKKCYEFSCWQFSDTYTKLNGYNYEDWNEYLLGKKADLSGYSYVLFLAKNRETYKIYIKYDDSATHLILNDPKFPQSIKNYNWLINNDIESIRFYNAKNDVTLDVDVPEKEKSFIKDVIKCIENYKQIIVDEYSQK